MSRRGPGFVSLSAGLAAAIAATATVLLRGRGWPWDAAYLIAINATSFALFAADKLSAGTGLPRVPERVLLGSAVLGGTPAAYLAQRLLRHKTSSRTFQSRFWLLAGAQLALLGGLGLWRLLG